MHRNAVGGIEGVKEQPQHVDLWHICVQGESGAGGAVQLDSPWLVN